jgi:hypothetical protein
MTIAGTFAICGAGWGAGFEPGLKCRLSKGESVRLQLSITLPRPLREIKEQIMCEAVRLFGTQKLAAKNLGISEAMLSRWLNRRHAPKSQARIGVRLEGKGCR